MISSWSLAKLSVMCAAITTVLLAGCGGKSFDYESGNEIPSGAGVFSGKDGEFTVYDSDAKPEDMDKQAPTRAGGTQNELDQTAPLNTLPAEASNENPEFQEFEQWKREKAEFEAFQR